MQKNIITAMIVDDDANSIQTLERDLAQYTEIKLLGTETSVTKAKKSIVKNQPDLLFLDVEFPLSNGIELLQEIRPSIYNRMQVVFYSAFDRYIIDALRASAFDFLLKPYRQEDLRQIIERLKHEPVSSMTNLEQSLRQLLNDENRFAVQTVNKLLLLRCSEILCFQYLEEPRCWQMTLTNLESYRLRLSTKANDILRMSASFIRVNTDSILNIDYLVSVENNSLRCMFCPPFEHIEMVASRRYFGKIRDRLQLL